MLSACVVGKLVKDPIFPPPTENLLATDYGFLASTPPQSPRYLAGSLVYQDYPAE